MAFSNAASIAVCPVRGRQQQQLSGALPKDVAASPLLSLFDCSCIGQAAADAGGRAFATGLFCRSQHDAGSIRL